MFEDQTPTESVRSKFLKRPGIGDASFQDHEIILAPNLDLGTDRKDINVDM